MGAERMMKPTMKKNDLISRSDAINAVSSLMPSLTTPDGTGSNDNEIISAQEMCFDALQALHELPTMDAAPMVHGRWDFSGVFGGNLIYQCNLCGRIIVLHEHGDLKKEFPYCHCGARMDGKEPTNEQQ